jgi:FkbM family methyltransferase
MRKFLITIFNCYQFRSKISVFNMFRLNYYEQNKTKKLIKIKLKNVRYPIYIRPSTTDLILVRNIFLSQEYPIFKDYFPQIIIDAGANIGLSSIYFKIFYPEARIFAIEPENSNCELFLKNLEPYPNITLIKGALLHECKLETKIINSDADKYSFRVSNLPNQEYPSEESLLSCSINQLVEKYNIKKIDILKMDIEGSEKDVFSENLEWIDITDNIFIELHEQICEGCSQNLIKAIANYPFKIRFKGENLILTKEREIFI